MLSIRHSVVGPPGTAFTPPIIAQSDVEPKRISRQMKFPRLAGRGDVDSFKNPSDLSDPAYIRYNDIGDARVEAPFRSFDNIIDPVSGFVSVGAEVDRGTGHRRIPTMVSLNFTPQSYNPKETDSIRMAESAPPELHRRSDRDFGTPYTWNGRRVSDAMLRSMLGGWTSQEDPRKAQQKSNTVQRDPTNELRDKLALQFMYTSATQKAYESVPWQDTLAPRRWPPTTTLEDRPDMISKCFNDKRYYPAAKEWQIVGQSWDRFQTRPGYYKHDSPIPGVTFKSSSSRSQQIPNYGGCIGGENILEIDNPDASFTPFTVKRVQIPAPSDTAHRPDIPLYTGNTLYRLPDYNHAMHSQPSPYYPLPQTAHIHHAFSSPNDFSTHRKSAAMSKLVTTVPPSNPFNRINKDQLVLGEKSNIIDIGEPKTKHPHEPVSQGS